MHRSNGKKVMLGHNESILGKLSTSTMQTPKKHCKGE